MKKSISALLFIVMLLTLIPPAYAVAPAEMAATDTPQAIVDGIDITVDIEEEIQRAISGITDLESPPNEITINSPEGTIVETYTTTREIKLPTSTYSSVSKEYTTAPKIYATTSVALLSTEKTSSDINNKDYVTAYGTIYWRDNAGMFNDFIKASGGWKTDINPNTGKAPTLSKRSVTMRAYLDASNDKYKTFGISSNSWTIYRSSFSYSAWIFHAKMSVTINNSATPFVLTVKTKMTD